MKFEVPEVLKCNYLARNIPKGVFLLPFTLLVIVVLLPLIRNFNQSSYNKIYASNSEPTTTRRCNIFSGNWAPYPEAPYYTNETCHLIYEEENCWMQGRPDKEFLKWRWKPNECELPLFDATLFFKLVRGKSMAFVGDSIGRNQMDSLLCLLNTVAHPPEDITARYATKDDIYCKWRFYSDYNFTLTMLWSPFLVKSNHTSFNNPDNLYLDKADKVWASRIENFDYVIISGGQWFFRPLTFYENDQVVECQRCQKNITKLNLYGYRIAFRTTLRTIRILKGFKGLTFLVTHSPGHFEGGGWNQGGTCDITKPFTKEERHTYENWDILQTSYQIQVEEFTAAETEARKKGLYFGLIDITEAMKIRPDGHPSRYGPFFHKNKRVNDCLHWCLPGPIDTWNEFLLYMMKLEGGN